MKETENIVSLEINIDSKDPLHYFLKIALIAAVGNCKELAIKQGILPVGYKLQSRQGNRFISSVTDAFARAGLPQDEFLKLCEIKLTSLIERFVAFNGMKKAQAERTVEEKLGEIIQRKSPSMSLVKEKNK